MSKIVNSGFEEGFHSFIRCSQDYFVFLWVLFFLSQNESKFKLIKYSLLIAAIISISYGLLQFFHMDILHRQTDINRLSGFHKNSYSYGGQLIIFFFLILNNLFLTCSKKKVFTIIFLIMCLFCILCTLERSVILSVFIGLALFLIIQKNHKIALFATVASVLGVILLALTVNKKFLKRVENILFAPDSLLGNVRFKVWDIAISIWKKNILFGTKEFPLIYHEVSSTHPAQILTHAHNTYLQILVTKGLIGFFAFINLFFSILYYSIKNLGKNTYVLSLFSVMIAFLVHGFFEFYWGDTEVRYLLIYFIGFVLSNSLDLKLKKE
ncbi:MAG: O-antigen ligase family protein [Candidatus Melainabacteria bacterium]|nr:O-antigen ligase family protein [Candidatus Melainabacteria bacterium]